MLRITTTPPEAKKLTSTSEADLEESKAAVEAPANAGGGWTKPGFIRGLSIGKSAGNPAATTEQGNATETTTTTGTASTSVPAPAAFVPADPLGVGEAGR